MLDRTLIFGGRDHLHVVVPLSLFDSFKDRMMPILDAPLDLNDSMQKELLDDFKKVVEDQFVGVGEDLINDLLHRWETGYDIQEAENAERDS